MERDMMSCLVETESFKKPTYLSNGPNDASRVEESSDPPCWSSDLGNCRVGKIIESSNLTDIVSVMQFDQTKRTLSKVEKKRKIVQRMCIFGWFGLWSGANSTLRELEWCAV